MVHGLWTLEGSWTLIDSCTGRSGLFEALSSENQAGLDQEASGQYDADLERHGVPDTP